MVKCDQLKQDLDVLTQTHEKICEEFRHVLQLRAESAQKEAEVSEQLQIVQVEKDSLRVALAEMEDRNEVALQERSLQIKKLESSLSNAAEQKTNLEARLSKLNMIVLQNADLEKRLEKTTADAARFKSAATNLVSQVQEYRTKFEQCTLQLEEHKASLVQCKQDLIYAKQDLKKQTQNEEDKV